jgi:hypothetical protein
MRIDSGITGDMAARLNNTVNQLRPNGPNDRGREAINIANEEGDTAAISQRARELAGGEPALLNAVEPASMENNIPAPANPAAEPRPVERTDLREQEPPPPPEQREPGPLDVVI